MKFEKKVISNLNLCYSLADLTYKGEHCFLVAAEKKDPCYLFSEEGRLISVPWMLPGGVMTMQQIPGKDGAFLATHEFYSPNDSKNAKIVLCEPGEKDGWKIRTLVTAPFVHRFGILRRNGVQYLIICCLKSDHEYKDDWRFPGAVYAAVLPEDLSAYGGENELPIKKIRDGMLKNHGYCHCASAEMDRALVTCEEGVFLFTPPEEPTADWEIEQLLDVPASDAVLCDFDGDGQAELGIIEDFHGDRLSIYHHDEQGKYKKCWEHSEPLEMLHAIWAGELGGKNYFLAGNRKGNRKTLLIFYEDGEYREELLEQDTGAANVLHFVNRKGQDVIVAANREINEVAMFTLKKDR